MKFHNAGVILASVLAVACTPQQDEPAPPSPEPSPPATSAEASAEDIAVEVYESMWGVVVDASHAGESDHPDLELYAMGEALTLMRQALAGAVEDGVSVEGEPVLSPEAVDSSPAEDPDTVELLDCMDSSEWTETGGEDSANTDSPGGNHQVDATVTFDGLSWRVSQMRIWEAGTC